MAGATTLTIGPVEIRNDKASGELLLLYPTPWFRLQGGAAAMRHRDQVDSIQLMTDAAGTDVEHSTYQPFGEARNVATGTLAAETKGFVGERYDASPQLQYLNARYYDPALSLFTSPDWLDVTDPGVGTNRFAYAGNSPLNQADPGGNSWLDSAWDSAFGEGSFNNTFGDSGSAWSDRNFGSGGETITGNLYEQEAPQGTSYGTYKSETIDRNNAIYSMEGVGSGDGVVLEAASYALDVGLVYQAGKWGWRAYKASGAAELAVESIPARAASSLQGKNLNMQLSAEQAAGARAPTAITSFAVHAETQILGRDGVGVSRAALQDAFANPLNIRYQPSRYGATFQYIGRDATVAVNVDGKVTTGWATNSMGIGR